MRTLLTFYALFLFVGMEPARASWLDHIGGDLKATVIDPPSGDPNLVTLGIIAGSGAATLLSYEFLDDRLAERQGNPHMEGTGIWLSRVGEWLPLAMPVGFFVASRIGENDPELQETAEELFESLAFTAATTYALKYSVRRRRPSSTEEAAFPSAHSSLAFSTAGILAQRYPWYVGVPSFMLASAIATSRVDLGKHYVSDVVAGAGIGLLFSFAVHQYHENLRSRESQSAKWIPTPWISTDSVGLTWANR